jgi:hypothetical protein
MLFRKNRDKNDFKEDIDNMVFMMKASNFAKLKKRIKELENEIVAFITEELPIVIREINLSYDVEENFFVSNLAERYKSDEGKYWDILCESEKGSVPRLRLIILGTEETPIFHGFRLITLDKNGQEKLPETLVVGISAERLRYIFTLHLESMEVKRKKGGINIFNEKMLARHREENERLGMSY